MLGDDAKKALVKWESGCLSMHRTFADGVDERWSAYKGELKPNQNAAQWTSKLHPPFVNSIVETTLSGLLDGKFAYKVRPLPRFWEPGEYERYAEGAKAHEILHAHQLRADRFDEKQRPFALQEAIAGLTVMKTSWKRERVERPELVVDPTGLISEQMGTVTVYDGPCSEVVDVRDFFWHEAAVDIQRSSVVAHRVYMTFEELKAGEKAGRFQNVDELKESKDPSGESNERTQMKDNRKRSKDMIEVLEIWWREPDGIKVVVLGNRRVELKPARNNPFWHGEYPFVTCSTRPDLFTLLGMSQVERIAHLQEAYWDLENQTRDNLRLINNAIFAVNTTMVADPAANEFAPGELWPVQGPVEEAYKSFSPDPMSTQISLPHLERISSTMQNLAGGVPFTSTSEARNVGANTATEAALTTNLAQKAMMAMKEQLNLAYERIGQQRTELNKQFMRKEIAIDQIGLDSEQEQINITPMLLQGEYQFDISPMTESMLRSERLAEANARLNTLQIIFPMAAAAAQVGAGTPLNIDAFVKDWLESSDVQDPERFFTKKAPPPPPVAPQQMQLPMGPPGPGGLTAPQASDMQSPNNQNSLSSEAAMATLMRQGQ